MPYSSEDLKKMLNGGREFVKDLTAVEEFDPHEIGYIVGLLTAKRVEEATIISPEFGMAIDEYLKEKVDPETLDTLKGNIENFLKYEKRENPELE
jgi:hypothetical protein